MSERRRNPLEITKTHLRQIGDGKASMIVAMRPEDFLRATTQDAAHMQSIIDEAQPLANYNRYAAEGQNIIPPLLRIRIEKSGLAGLYEGAPEWRGEVEAHEGRHRAAATMKEEPGTLMPVAILIRSDDREWKETVTPGDPWSAIYYAKLHHLPSNMEGEFKGRTLYRHAMQPLYYRDPDGGKGPSGFHHVNLPLDVATTLREVRENPIPIELTPFTADEVRFTTRSREEPWAWIAVEMWVSAAGLVRVGGNTLYSYAEDWQEQEWWLVKRAMEEKKWPGSGWFLVGYIEVAAFESEDDGLLRDMFEEVRGEGYYQHDDAYEDEWDRDDHFSEMKSDLGISRGRFAYFVSQSRVNPKLHGMKMGAYLYTKAMDEVVKRGAVLVSAGYGDRSEKASRLWRSGERKGGTLREHGYHTRSVGAAEDDPTYQMRHYTYTGKPRAKRAKRAQRRRVPRKRAKRKVNPSGPTSTELMRLEAEGLTPQQYSAHMGWATDDAGLGDFIKGHRERIDIAVGAPIDWDHAYGCGAFGCAYPIPSRPELVLKVTTDPQEGPITQAIMETGYDKSMPGLARIENVWRVPHLAYDDVVTPPELYLDEVYLVLRENIEPIADRYLKRVGPDWDHRSPVPEAHHAMIVFSTEVRNLYAAQKNAIYQEGLLQRVLHKDEAAVMHAERLIESFDVPTPTYAETLASVQRRVRHARERLERTEIATERALNMMKYDRSTRDIGRALKKLGEKGIYLADLHLGNLGFHLFEWVGGIAQAVSRGSTGDPWCVFDYGASPSLVEPSVPLMPGARDIHEGEVEFLMSRQRQVRENPALEDVRQRIKRL